MSTKWSNNKCIILLFIVTGKNINLVLTGSYGFVEQPYSQQQNTGEYSC